MKNFILILMLVGLVACHSKQAASSQEIKNPSAEKTTTSQIFDVRFDTLNSVEKENHFHEASFKEDEWKDTYCPVCNRRCCSPCTGGGDPSVCAQTRFQNCSTCGHSSRGHHPVSH